MSPLRWSVVIPVRESASALPAVLAALCDSDLPRDCWELIVVDDASTDGTGQVAAACGSRIVTLSGPAHGPAYARNRGVECASAEWVVFIDADVVVHRDTLRRFAEAIVEDPTIDALFGTYDEAPPAAGFLSQYRNLLHRYLHLQGAGEADSFWAGCGAIRRAALLQAGGFAEDRYRRPQIEDIDLGYRLKDLGKRIVLRPEIQATHLKRWRFWSSMRTDVFDRGIPWVRLLLERHRLTRPSTLNLRPHERLLIALTSGAVLLLALAVVVRRPVPAIVGVAALLVVVLSRLPMLRWFVRQRGVGFTLRVVPLTLLYYLLSGLSVLGGVVLHLWEGRGMRPANPPLPRELALAFAPLHKAAFGAAVGTALALLLFLATAFTILRRVDQPGLALLAEYFRGYSVSWGGAVLGAAWGGFVGFVFGWFLAFCRNLVLAISLVVIRSRAERAQTRDFLDHI